MALKSETRDFGNGLKVHCTQHPPRKALRLFWRLGKIAPRVIAKLNLKNPTANDVFPVMLELFEQLDPDQVDELVLELLSHSLVETKGGLVAVTPQTFDQVFEGELMGIFAAAAFSVEVNFGSFIVGALLGLNSAPDSAEQAPESQSSASASK